MKRALRIGGILRADRVGFLSYVCEATQILLWIALAVVLVLQSLETTGDRTGDVNGDDLVKDI